MGGAQVSAGAVGMVWGGDDREGRESRGCSLGTLPSLHDEFLSSLF